MNCFNYRVFWYNAVLFLLLIFYTCKVLPTYYFEHIKYATFLHVHYLLLKGSVSINNQPNALSKLLYNVAGNTKL